MQHELALPRSEEPRRSRRYWLHLGDNLFRHLLLYAAPVVILTAIGVVVVQGSEAEYKSTATVDASTNPLVQNLSEDEDSFFFRTPALATGEFINEQFRTDVFTTSVAESAGLDTDVVGVNTVRNNVGARANGDSLVAISATWADPNTARQLAQATIDTYRATVVDTVAAESRAAEEFFTDLLDEAEEASNQAQDELDEFVAGLPAVANTNDYTVAEQLEIERLTNALERADTNVENAQDQIQEAQLRVAQSRSEAGESIRLIDQPSLPDSPEPRLFQMVSVVAVFFVLGIIVSTAALLLTTAFDRTVRFDLDVIESANSATVASVGTIKSLRRQPAALRWVPAGELGSGDDDSDQEPLSDDADDLGDSEDDDRVDTEDGNIEDVETTDPADDDDQVDSELTDSSTR